MKLPIFLEWETIASKGCKLNIEVYCVVTDRKYQSYKGAVGTTLCENKAELKISKEIDHQILSTDQAGKIRPTELIINIMGE